MHDLPMGHDPLHDLEHLTALAFLCLDSAKRDPPESLHRPRVRVRTSFQIVCQLADSLIRIHPKSTYYPTYGRIMWSPAAIAALARVLMEAAVNVHYFGDASITEEEREFRGIIAILNYLREWEDRACRLEESSPTQEPIPENWSGLDPSEQAMILPRLQRRTVPGNLLAWQDELERNVYYQLLEDAKRQKWLSGKGLFHKNGRYIGHRNHAGFGGTTPNARAEDAGLSGLMYDLLRDKLSASVHSAPLPSDVVPFIPVDRIAMETQIELPLAVSAGHVALTIESFLPTFPECRELFDAPKQALLQIGLAYLTLLGLRTED